MKKKSFYIVITLLILVGLAVFGRTAGNHFINLDDPGYLTKNNIVQNGLTLQGIRWAFASTYLAFWHPLTWLSHMLDWSLFGDKAGGHHLVSLLLHMGSVLFLFLFLNKTTNHIWSSAFAAAFFALHPLRVESVAWAAERKDVLSMFFGMASIYAYAYYADHAKPSHYFLCLVLFALSLMSKPMMVTLPFIFLLLDYWPLGRWQDVLSAPTGDRCKFTGGLLVEKIPFLILAIASSVVVFWAEKKAGALPPVDALSLSTRFVNGMVSYVTYLTKTFWPMDLIVFYPYDFFLPSWKIIISSIILIFMTSAVIYYFKKRPFLSVGWFWYLGTLIPMIGLVQVGKHALADRYTYLPSVGIAIMLAWGIPSLFKKDVNHKRVLFPAVMAVLICMALFTWKQCGYWKSSFSLFNHASRIMGDKNPTPQNSGSDFTELGQYQKQREIQKLTSLIQMNPQDALAYYNRGLAYSNIEQYQNAIRDYNQAIRLKPDFEEAYNNRGNIYGQHGQYALAINDFNQLIRLNARNFKAYHNRGLAYMELGHYPDAMKDFNAAINLKPDYGSAYHNRASIYIRQGDSVSGCRDAKKACALGLCQMLDLAQGKGFCR